MLDQHYPVKNRKQFVAGLFLCMVLMAGCTSSKPFLAEDEAKNEQTKEKILLLSEYEGTLNPVDFDHEIEFVQKAQGTERKQPNTLEIPRDSLIVQEEAVQGFRIQIFSSTPIKWYFQLLFKILSIMELNIIKLPDEVLPCQ